MSKGTDIIVQGDKDADNFYCVQTGSCDIYVDDSKRTEYGPGRFFGELALLYDAPRAATVRAGEDCLLWRLDRVRRCLVLNAGCRDAKEPLPFHRHALFCYVLTAAVGRARCAIACVSR